MQIDSSRLVGIVEIQSLQLDEGRKRDATANSALIDQLEQLLAPPWAHDPTRCTTSTGGCRVLDSAVPTEIVPVEAAVEANLTGLREDLDKRYARLRRKIAALQRLS